MEPTTLKIAAHIVLSLGKSKTLRRTFIIAAIVQAVVSGFVVLAPTYLMTSIAPAMHKVATVQACAGEPGANGSVPVPSGAGAELSVTMATWNVLKTNSVQRIVDGLQTIATAGADVMAVQELSNTRRAAVTGQMKQAGWAAPNPSTATTVFWRAAKYTLLAQGQVKELGVVRIEPGNAAGTSIGPKYIQWVQLRDRSSGATFVAASHHLLPGIEAGGHPNSEAPRRVAYAKRQILAAGELADRLSRNGQIPFMIAADWNIDARADAKIRSTGFPFVTLQQHDLYSNWRVLGYPAAGTHANHRLIDGIFSTTRSAAPASQQMLGSYGSDHQAVLVRYSNRSPGTATALTDDSRAQLGSVPDTITVPSARPGQTMTLAGEQITNAATVIAEGRKARIPQYGWVIAIAAALQESGLENLSYGDRDSQGLFQQRPSSGWGTVHQIRDPRLSSRAFYGVASHTRIPGLVDIRGWQTMSVTEAAQAVQVSAFPSAYAKWEAAARAVVQQLSNGQSLPTTALLCGTSQDAQLGECPPSGSPAEKGLTRDALLVLRCTKAKFPMLTDFGGVHPDPLPDHPSGRAVDLMIPAYSTSQGRALGWQIARWLKDHRQALGVQYVIFDARIWSVERDREGWRGYSPGYTSSINDSSLHRNHVHVTTYGNAGAGFQTDDGAGRTASAGQWTMALPAGSYSIGCAFACYTSATGLAHTGQDFPTAVGTPVRSTNSGTVEVSRDLAGSYGRYIVIRDQTNPAITIYYAHLSARNVRPGQRVATGQLIGLSGTTGNSSGPHLHYEIRIDGNPVNPMPILTRNGVHP